MPSDVNAPPRDRSGKLVFVHNNIIENYAALRRKLQRQDHRFPSQTDTEVLAHFIGHHQESAWDPVLSRMVAQYFA